MSEPEEAPITEEQVAEANEPEPEPEPEPDALTEPDAESASEPTAEPQGLSPEQWEERFRKHATALKTYTSRVSAIFEEEANDLTPCPLCVGGVQGFVDVNAAGKIDPEVKRLVETFIGVVTEAEYRPSRTVEACSDCNGLGKVLSGSRVANYKTLNCPRCKATGFYPPPGEGANGRVEQAPVLVTAGGEETAVAPPEADPWGSPRLLADGTENPNYGRMPQFKDAALP